MHHPSPLPPSCSSPPPSVLLLLSRILPIILNSLAYLLVRKHSETLKKIL